MCRSQYSHAAGLGFPIDSADCNRGDARSGRFDKSLGLEASPQMHDHLYLGHWVAREE
jgi:hypothetical protein